MASSDNDIAGRLVLITGKRVYIQFQDRNVPGLIRTTGASGGIGSACARQFLSCGCDLALTYSSNRSALESLVDEFKTIAAQSQRKQQISIHQADLASPEQTTKLCEDVQKAHNRAVDILISNAGYGKRIRDVSEIPLSEFEITLNVNLRAPFLLVKGVVDGMKAQKWGRIIFVSSIAAYGGGMNGQGSTSFFTVSSTDSSQGCHYAASKGGMVCASL
jgi:3-oxoacyl-[acyl-carrier protein] reductase